MGGAFVGVGDDATAVYWNPAGLALLDDTRLAGMSTSLFGLPTDLTHQYVGVVTTIANIGIGLAWERLAVGGAFDVSEQLFVGTLGTSVLDIGLVGANVKYYTANQSGISGSGFGFDLGLLVNIGDMFSVGLCASDIGGTRVSYADNDTDVISGLYRAGVALSLVEEMLVLAADIDFVGTSMGNAHVGLEFQVIDELALRGGIVLTDNFGDYYFAVGAGINVAGLYVDAAYILEETLGNTLVLSAEFSLGDLLGEDEPEEPDVTE
jgi:hypothetical protein